MKNIASGIFLDVKKEFEKTSHTLQLKKKIEHVEIRGIFSKVIHPKGWFG